MSGKSDRLELLLRVRKLEVASSERAALRRGKELSAAAAASLSAAGRHYAARSAEAQALAARNASPGDPAVLFHSRACASRTQGADAALRDCRTREAEADDAAKQARRELLYAETRHEGVITRVRAEHARGRRRADRRREEEPGSSRPMFFQDDQR